LPDNSTVWSIAITAIASVLIGFALSTLAYRTRLLRVPGGSFVERLDHHVNLTPAQREQISGIMRDTRGKIDGLKRDYLRARRSSMWDSYDKVRAVLTPDQQKVFDRDFSPPWGSRRDSESDSSIPAAVPSAMH
jgi:Spy/CpxP family protein refolding chaperone